MIGVIKLVTITVCIGSSCHLKSSYDVVNELQRLISENKLDKAVKVKASFCLGNCKNPVSVKVNDGPVMSVSKDNVSEFFKEQVMKNL